MVGISAAVALFSATTSPSGWLWALVIYTALIFCLVGGLLAYHSSLITSNLTTNEVLKQVYANRANPYDRGCLSNWTTFLRQTLARPRPSYMTGAGFARVNVRLNGSDDDAIEERSALLRTEAGTQSQVV